MKVQNNFPFHADGKRVYLKEIKKELNKLKAPLETSKRKTLIEKLKASKYLNF